MVFLYFWSVFFELLWYVRAVAARDARLAQNTVEPDTQDQGEALIAEAGAKATEEAPLARISMEADNDGRGAGLTLQAWPGGDRTQLARIDFHGRWIDWTG